MGLGPLWREGTPPALGDGAGEGRHKPEPTSVRSARRAVRVRGPVVPRCGVISLIKGIMHAA